MSPFDLLTICFFVAVIFFVLGFAWGEDCATKAAKKLSSGAILRWKEQRTHNETVVAELRVSIRHANERIEELGLDVDNANRNAIAINDRYRELQQRYYAAMKATVAARETLENVNDDEVQF